MKKTMLVGLIISTFSVSAISAEHWVDPYQLKMDNAINANTKKEVQNCLDKKLAKNTLQCELIADEKLDHLYPKRGSSTYEKLHYKNLSVAQAEKMLKKLVKYFDTHDIGSQSTVDWPGKVTRHELNKEAGYLLVNVINNLNYTPSIDGAKTYIKLHR